MAVDESRTDPAAQPSSVTAAQPLTVTAAQPLPITAAQPPRPAAKPQLSTAKPLVRQAAQSSARRTPARRSAQNGSPRRNAGQAVRLVEPAAARSLVAAVPQRRVYVLDTSVLLADPGALLRFAEQEVVLPLIVISELEGKRHHPEIGAFARQALRILDELRVKHGRLDVPVPVNEDGGTARVELNHTDPEVLPVGFRSETNDARILSVALGLAAQGREVTLVTRDIPLRVKAAAVGLAADEYRHGQASDPTWSGMAEVDLTDEQMTMLYAGTPVEHGVAGSLPCHTGLVLHSSNGSALGRLQPDKSVRLVRGDREAFGLRGRSAGGLAPANRRSRCAPVWRRSWSGGGTAR